MTDKIIQLQTKIRLHQRLPIIATLVVILVFLVWTIIQSLVFVSTKQVQQWSTTANDWTTVTVPTYGLFQSENLIWEVALWMSIGAVIAFVAFVVVAKITDKTIVNMKAQLRDIQNAKK